LNAKNEVHEMHWVGIDPGLNHVGIGIIKERFTMEPRGDEQRKVTLDLLPVTAAYLNIEYPEGGKPQKNPLLIREAAHQTISVMSQTLDSHALVGKFTLAIEDIIFMGARTTDIAMAMCKLVWLLTGLLRGTHAEPMVVSPTDWRKWLTGKAQAQPADTRAAILQQGLAPEGLVLQLEGQQDHMQDAIGVAYGAWAAANAGRRVYSFARMLMPGSAQA